MESNRTTGEGIDLFLLSEAAHEFIRPGAEQTFGVALAEFIAQLNLDRWEGDLGYPDYLDQEIDVFIDRVGDAGYLDIFPIDHVSMVELRGELLQVVELGLEARYDAEVEQGRREDMREPRMSEDEENRLTVAMDQAKRDLSAPSLTERVQAFVQAVKDFVHGRDMEDPTQEHGAER